MKEIIKSIVIDYKDGSLGIICSTEEEPIEKFTKNGEMALVDWFRKGNKEFNGKYVIEIEYTTPTQSNGDNTKE